MAKRISYRTAIQYLADEEDLEAYFDSNPIPTAACNVIADLFEVPAREVISEVRHRATLDGRWG